MPKAISIVRVSTTGQATEDRAGLESQRVAIARIAADHDLEIVRELQLAGVSGARVMDDPRFLDMLLAIESAEIAGVVVAHLDRLMRPEDPGYYAIFGRFRDTATILYTSEGPKDFRRDRLLMMLQSEIAAYERERIRERTMRGKEVHRRAGRHVAGPEGLPFAVDYRTENGRPVWSYRWPEAATARAVYERALAGEHNFSRLARDLGITRTLVRRILSNPIYAGVRRITHRYAGHRAHLRAAEDVIEHQVLDPPLVPMAWWEAAQPLLGNRFQVRRDSPCLYRGIARCGACQLPMHSHRDTHSGRWGYRCRSAARHSCGVGWLKREAVELAADRAVVEHLAKPDVLALALRGALEPTDEAAPDRDNAERRIELLTRERGRVIESFEAGLRTLAEAEVRTRAIEAEIRTLRRALQQKPQSGSLERLAAELAAPFAEWQYLTSDQRRRIVMASVRTLDVLRAGRAEACIRAVELTFPVSPSPPPHTPLVEGYYAVGLDSGAISDPLLDFDTTPPGLPPVDRSPDVPAWDVEPYVYQVEPAPFQHVVFRRVLSLQKTVLVPPGIPVCQSPGTRLVSYGTLYRDFDPIDPSGFAEGTLEVADGTPLRCPTALATGLDGALYVADAALPFGGDAQIVRLLPGSGADPAVVASLPGNATQPMGLAVAPVSAPEPGEVGEGLAALVGLLGTRCRRSALRRSSRQGAPSALAQ